MALDELYKEVILDHYKSPRNKRGLENPSYTCTRNNPLCGDEIEVDLRVDDGVVAEATFQGAGCSISQSSASMMTEAVKGHSISDAEVAVQRFTQNMSNRTAAPTEMEEELDALQGVKRYPARVKCALLPWTTLRETVDLYRHREPSNEPHEDCADAP